MKHFLFYLFVCATTFAHSAEPWRQRLKNAEEGVLVNIDLYEESITVPGMEMFGPMNGYVNGKGIYGVWSVTSFAIKDERMATLRLSNDLGSETQAVTLTWQSDTTCLMELQGSVVMKRAEGRKLVKISPKMLLHVRP